MAEFVTLKYLQFLELLAQNQVHNGYQKADSENEGEQRKDSDEPEVRLQHLLFEVFKRILNYAKAQQTRAAESDQAKYLQGNPPLPQNFELPIPLAQACLVLAKHIEPESEDGKRNNF